MEAVQSTESSQTGGARGRGRGKSRGGLGKYLRARGRGRGGGRPAEFGKRLVLEDEEIEELDPDSEEAIQARELQQKFSRRQLGTNADRYAEPEPVLNSDGEEEVEPEVDLSSFLERQRLSEATPGPSSAPPPPDDDDEVDHSLAHISSRRQDPSQSRKGKVQTVEWDADLDEMTREKAAAEATWDLKTRFKAKSEKMRTKPTPQGRDRKPEKVIEAPLLPTEIAAQPAKDPRGEMQDFLDDLLS